MSEDIETLSEAEKNKLLRKSVLKDIVNTGVMFFSDYHVNTKNRKMSFRYMPYMKQIYFDESAKIIVMSSVQTGKSEWALIKAFACTDTGLNVFHVFSTNEAKNSFVKGRVDELCDRVPVYQKMEKDTRRNRYLRSMGEASWKFVISNSPTHFDEFPADVIIIDEKDSCNQDNIRLANTRTENSEYKFEWFVGNPSVENMGISEDYEKSKKYEWHFQCKKPKCRKLFRADLFECVVDEIVDKEKNHIAYKLYDEEWNEMLERDIMLRCPHCGLLQERQDRAVQGQRPRWVAKNPEAKISGYWISKLMKLNSPVKELWIELIEAEGNDYKMQIFYNKKLGLPYTGTGAKVTKAMLDRLIYDYTVRDQCTKPTVAGMDVGDKFDVQIDIKAVQDKKRKRLFLNAYRCVSLDDVKILISVFNIKTMCVGIKPERHLMENFRKDMMGICNIILIEELEGKTGNLKLMGFQENEELGVIKVDRTWLLDEAMKNIRKKLNILPKGYESILDGYWVKSMTSITRVLLNEKNEYRWSKADFDHFRFADAFSMLAWMKDKEAILVGDNDLKKGKIEPVNRMIGKDKRSNSTGIIKRRMGIAKSRGKSIFRRVEEDNQ